MGQGRQATRRGQKYAHRRRRFASRGAVGASPPFPRATPLRATQHTERQRETSLDDKMAAPPLKLDFDVELVEAEASAPGKEDATPTTLAAPPVRAGATVLICAGDQAGQYVVRHAESRDLLGPVPDKAARRFPPPPPTPPSDLATPAEVRSVRRPKEPQQEQHEEAATPQTRTTVLSVRLILPDGGRAWPPSLDQASAEAERARLAAAAAAARREADAAAAANDDALGAGYRARPEELARLALSSEVREALRDPRLHRLLQEIDGAPDRERALRSALGLPAEAAGAGAVAAPAAGAFGVDGGAFQNFAALVLETMDGGAAAGSGRRLGGS
jgi:hypothetical protein